MMANDELFGGRGRDLEEAFFAEQNQRLLRELREQTARRERREALSKATGIQTEGVLDRLVELEVTVERAAAFFLVPLVEVAWADGKIQPGEREAILRAAAERGIEDGSVPYELLETWLERPPDRRLMEVWREYATAFVGSLPPEMRAAFRAEILDRARTVAQAAGGFLGMGRVSDEEQAMLDRLTAALD